MKGVAREGDRRAEQCLGSSFTHVYSLSTEVLECEGLGVCTQAPPSGVHPLSREEDTLWMTIYRCDKGYKECSEGAGLQGQQRPLHWVSKDLWKVSNQTQVFIKALLQVSFCSHSHCV